MPTKQTIESTIAGIKDLDPEYKGSTQFCAIFFNSIEEGMDRPSPFLIKENLKKVGLNLVVEEKKGVNVPVKVTFLSDKLDAEGNKKTILVAEGRAPTANEALLLAICAEVRTELKAAKVVVEPTGLAL